MGKSSQTSERKGMNIMHGWGQIILSAKYGAHCHYEREGVGLVGGAKLQDIPQMPIPLSI